MYKALVLREKGHWSNLKVEERPIPQAKPGKAVVKVFAAAVNPSDVKNIKGLFPTTTLPRVPGRDFSGVVVDGPAELRGKEVWGTGGQSGFTEDGSHAQYIVVPDDSLAEKPEGLSHVEAAGCGVGFLTAYSAVVELAQLKAGESILVHGAKGAVGSAAAMLAKSLGARVIGGLRGNPTDLPASNNIFDGFVSTDVDFDLKEQVLKHTNGQGVDVVVDTIGGPLLARSLQALAPHGRLVNMAVPAGQPNATFDLFDFYRRELKLFGLNTLHISSQRAAEVLRTLRPAFESGALAPPQTQVFSLELAQQAYQAVESGSKSKIVFQMF